MLILLGQDHVTKTIINAFKIKRIAQGYIFTGPRGVGKTTMARVVAMALNAESEPKHDFNPDTVIAKEISKGQSLDVLEIDGADDWGNTLQMTKHLEVGKAYFWNTKIQHRVRETGGAKEPRVHIVVGFIPWFDKDGDDWKPNKYFGIQPIDMIRSKMIFPYAP